jgi:hypothetical protein
MGLISDRKSKAKSRDNVSGAGSGGKSFQLGGSPKRGLFGPQVLPKMGSQTLLPAYPAGYYTTPNLHSSASWTNLHHPGQPKLNPNVSPRYQTWVAPRKQPSLNQLVRIKEAHSSRLTKRRNQNLESIQ